MTSVSDTACPHAGAAGALRARRRRRRDLARPGCGCNSRRLVRAAAAQPNPRGRALLNLVLDTIDPRSESPGESVGRGVIVWSGFEPPERQREFRSEGFVDRADYAWESVHAIAESDGYGKYLGRNARQETVRRASNEKQREDRLRRCAWASGGGTWLPRQRSHLSSTSWSEWRPRGWVRRARSSCRRCGAIPGGRGPGREKPLDAPKNQPRRMSRRICGVPPREGSAPAQRGPAAIGRATPGRRARAASSS